MVTLLSTGNSLMQLNVTDELRGRLMSLFGLIVMGFAPVGSILYGVSAHYVGAGPVITGGACLAALVRRGRAPEESGPAALWLHRAGGAGPKPHPPCHYAL